MFMVTACPYTLAGDGYSIPVHHPLASKSAGTPPSLTHYIHVCESVKTPLMVFQLFALAGFYTQFIS